MKRILCIISSLNAGGAETFLMKLYRELDRTKYQMDFCINTEEECVHSKEALNLGGKIFYIPAKSTDFKGFQKGLADLVKQEKYQYVLRVTSNAAGFLDLKIAKQAGAKRTAARSSNSSDGVGLKAKIIHIISRFLYRKYVDVKFAPSDLAAEYTFGKRAVQKGQVAFLHNAVDLDIYHFDAAGREAVRKEFGIGDRTVIGHIGRFNTQKNHTFLLDIFAKIKEKQPDAVLMLVGTGDLEQKIRQKVEQLGLINDVIFTGVRSDVPQLLSAMDAFLFPSFYEGMPNTVIEAEATGLPCVISDTITKEADITGLITYLPLEYSAETWAEHVLASISHERKDTKQNFIDHQYDIASATKAFVALVFGEE